MKRVVSDYYFWDRVLYTYCAYPQKNEEGKSSE